ncbi:MAG: GerMN domain-containing protein, partial [Candidatus Limnocylindrales bacterium]|nr:GerMN domain-containing protein [Candidatus Limnocylindrales bacterium]
PGAIAMNRGRQPSVVVLTVLALVAIVAACSPSGGLGQVPSRAPTPAPASSAAPNGSPDASPPASPGTTTIVRTYFYLGGEPGSAGLVSLLREVPETRALAGAAMSALLAGPTADESAERVITSAVPAGSRLLGLSIENGSATVDLSSEFESGGGSASVFIRLGQVVYTLTQFPTVQSVVFEIEGRPVTVFSSEGIVLDGPVGRDDYDDLLPAIFVDRPAYGAGVGNPARITGSANVFEAAFLVTLLDGSGATIAQVPAMATCGTGCRGTFDVTVPYSVPEAGWGTLRVWDGSAKDGSPENVREYPVWLTPAG